MRRVQSAGLVADIPDAVWKTAWNVNCQPVGDAANTLGYLARYVFKVAISDQRILEVSDGQVRFAYTKPASSRRRTMVLTVHEFIRRLLQHVLPTGFMKVRHYGFLFPSLRIPLAQVKARVEMAHGFAARSVNTELDAPAAKPMVCSHCGGALKLLRVMRAATRPSAPCVSSSSLATLAAGP